MTPSLDQGDGSSTIPGHDSRVLFIQEVASSKYAPHTHSIEERSHSGEALYHISKGFWFIPVELIMTSLFHFEEKVHLKNVTRDESTPLLFPRLLC